MLGAWKGLLFTCHILKRGGGGRKKLTSPLMGSWWCHITTHRFFGLQVKQLPWVLIGYFALRGGGWSFFPSFPLAPGLIPVPQWAHLFCFPLSCSLCQNSVYARWCCVPGQSRPPNQGGSSYAATKGKGNAKKKKKIRKINLIYAKTLSWRTVWSLSLVFLAVMNSVLNPVLHSALRCETQCHAPPSQSRLGLQVASCLPVFLSSGTAGAINQNPPPPLSPSSPGSEQQHNITRASHLNISLHLLLISRLFRTI